MAEKEKWVMYGLIAAGILGACIQGNKWWGAHQLAMIFFLTQFVRSP